MSSDRGLERVEARLQSLEKDLTTVRSGGRLGPFRAVPSSTSDRLRHLSAWQALLALGSALVVAAVVVALI